VVTYGDAATAPIEGPVVHVDFAGDAGLLRTIHTRFGDQLTHSCLVGGTHWEGERNGGSLPGPRPVFFFAPDRIKKRSGDWGPGGLDERFQAAWDPFVVDAARWLKVHHGKGPQVIADTYRAVLEGRAGPEMGHILIP